MQYMWVSSVYDFDFNGLMEPHMIENHIHYMFAFEFNHVGFILVTFVPRRPEPGASSFNIYNHFFAIPYICQPLPPKILRSRKSTPIMRL